jgi:hypothetical protein
VIMVLANELAKNSAKTEKLFLSPWVSEDGTAFVLFWRPTRFRVHLIAHKYGGRCGLEILQRL